MPTPSWLDDTLPYLTAAVPAIGGRIRSAPEDFRVEERPLYLPCGKGRTFVYSGDQARSVHPGSAARDSRRSSMSERNLSGWPG